MTTKSVYINLTNNNNYITHGSEIFSVNYLENKFSIKTNFAIVNKPLYILVPSGFIKKTNSVSLNKNFNNLDKLFYNTSFTADTAFSLKKKTKWLFKKFKYHGKGYKIKKVNSLSKITFRFGKSHWTKVFFNQKTINVKRTKKNSYMLITIKKKNLKFIGPLLKEIKGMSVYTKRGVRLTRQLVKKRYGKVSQANSVYK